MCKDIIESLFTPEARLIKEINYKLALEDIEYFAIAPQVYFLLKQQGKLFQTPAFFQGRLKDLFDQALFQNIFIKNQTSQILTMFEALGIDVIPLKGTVFAENYFGHLGARPTSDIDLLIREQDLEKAAECIKKLGFSVEEEPIPEHFHACFSKELPNSLIPLTVELHWDLLKKNTAQFDINEFWNDAKTVNSFLHIKKLSNYHTFYMICLHGWRHNLESLKYFIDIIQLIVNLRDELNYGRLVENAASHKTRNRIVRTLSIVYQQYPFLHEVKEFPYMYKHVHWDYQSFRNRTRKTVRTYLDFFDYQLLSYDSPRHSLIEMKNWISVLKPSNL